MPLPRIPTPVPGLDVRKLPLNTTEGFVLSRVDGSASVEDISMMSGIDAGKVLSILERLAELGAVGLPWAPARPKPAGARPDGPRATGERSMPPMRAPDAHFMPKRPRYSANEVEERADISVETRRRILNAFYAIEGRDLYAVLGVQRKADKRAIRDAYFELSKVFHPDAYFGKQLGSFKPKMEAVFKKLTEAYETLGKSKKRAEYDEYLQTTERTRAARQTLDSLEFSAAEIQAMQEAAERVRAAEQAPAEQMPSSEALRPPRAPKIEQPTVPESAPPAVTQPPRAAPSTAERRARVRDRLLQRMGSISQRPPPMPPPSDKPVEQSSSQRRRSVIDGLRQSIRVSTGVTGAASGQALSFLKKAKDAERAGDPLFAASQLQAGLVVDPNNPELLAEYERVSKVVARNLADNYEKQAQYEEKTSNWEAAARSWARVSDGRPEDPNAARSAAEAMLKTRADLHRAQKYAQKAVDLDGKNVTNLTVLARVYLAAGLKLNAVRELEKAAHLAPRDEMVNNLLREAR